MTTRTHVLVVMHHREAHRTSNTGRLAVRILANGSCLLRGSLRDEPPPPAFAGRRLVLFPSETARPLEPADAVEPTLLVVPDGTWSQAQRVLRREAVARDAEVVRLPSPPKTRYPLRRNTRDGGLSTFEAIANALGLFEGAELEARMLGLFDEFVARALAVRGRRYVAPAEA